MSAPSFVRQDLVPERPAPVKTTGFVGFLRTRLFNTPTNILITIVGVLLLWFIVVPALKFALIDAVWTGKDRDACLAEKVGHTVGACWPFVTAKFSQFIYGFYPEAERWRVNLTFLLAAVLLTWLRDQIQSFGRPLWADLAATTAIVSGLMFWLGGGMRAGVRPLITSLVIFACIGIVVAIMGLDRGGLPVVDTRLWGGLLV